MKLEKFYHWINKGYLIYYDVIDQISNGYKDEVIAGNMPRYTFTFQIEKEGVIIWVKSVDTLEDGISSSIRYLEGILGSPEGYRICTHCNGEMDEGFVIEDGQAYYCDKECLYKEVPKEEYLELHDGGEGDTYWTYFWDEV